MFPSISKCLFFTTLAADVSAWTLQAQQLLVHVVRAAVLGTSPVNLTD
jgi:hypothetical protein